MKPPNVKINWDDNDTWTQAKLIAYGQIRSYEEDQDQINLYKCLGAKI